MENIQIKSLSVEELEILIKKNISEAFATHNYKDKSNSGEDDLINIKQLGLILGLSKPTIYKYMKMGIIPYQRVGQKNLRFRKKEVLESIQLENQKSVKFHSV